MKTKIDEISSSVRELTFTIDAETTEKEYRKSMQKIKRLVVVPGFRKGKAPLSMVEELYGENIKDEFKDQIVDEYFPKALEESGLSPISQAQLVKVDYEKGKEFSATLRIEVMPEITEVKYLNLEIPYEPMELTESMVDDVIEENRSKMTTNEEVEDSTLITMEHLVNFLVKYKSDKPEEDAFINLTDKEEDEEFKKSFLGHKVDDTFENTFAGEPAEIKINSVEREVKPEINDQFAQDLEFADVTEMRKSFEEIIKAELDAKNEDQLHGAIISTLIEANPIEMPQSLIVKHAKELAEPYIKAYKISEEQVLPMYMKIAENNILRYVLFNKIKEMEKIEVTEDDRESTIIKAAKNLKIDVEEYKKMYKKEIENEDFRLKIEELKILDLIAKSGKIVPYPKEEEKANEKTITEQNSDEKTTEQKTEEVE